MEDLKDVAAGRVLVAPQQVAEMSVRPWSS